MGKKGKDKKKLTRVEKDKGREGIFFEPIKFDELKARERKLIKTVSR